MIEFLVLNVDENLLLTELKNMRWLVQKLLKRDKCFK